MPRPYDRPVPYLSDTLELKRKRCGCHEAESGEKIIGCKRHLAEEAEAIARRNSERAA